MIRFRLALGLALLLLNGPVFIRSMIDTSAHPGGYIASAILTGLAIALLWPARWTDG